jgi:mono/diheme cytochrome c family protein
MKIQGLHVMNSSYKNILIAIIILTANLMAVDTAENFYQINCKACHTIGGGKLIGPDLMDVETRKDREWLINWIEDPAAVLASGDAYANKIFEESNKVPMIKSPGITKEIAAELLDYIAKITSEGGEKEVTWEAPKFTTEDISKGRSYFSGSLKFENGAPPCVSCHTVNSIPGLGGGRLGVNLTDVYQRLGESRGLSVWLEAPPTATMVPIFSKHVLNEQEIISLMAFFKNEVEVQSRPQFASVANFILYGILGTIIFFSVFGAIWANRFKAVRRPMVKGKK